MSDPALETLRPLVLERRIAALGTLHGGEPFVSMVPFAPLPDGSGFVIHVSQLSAHTRDMLASPRVSLLLVGSESGDVPAQAVPRVTIQGDAEPLPDTAAGYEEAREAYLSRFPQSEGMFELGDFSLFVIRPASLRVIGGFGRATTLGPGALGESLNN